MSTVAAMTPPRVSHDRIPVDRWPSEVPLFALSVLIALPIWLLLVVTMVGMIYALAIGAMVFVMHLGFVSHVRGSAVRLGPDQFPQLHARVELLAERMGLARVPEAYLMQAGGALNALATRFLRSNMIILFSDLLEACGDNEAARDMIIAHELGHIRAGHLRWRWLIMPSLIVPFLGTALSRAREYTCDRIGRAGAGSTEGALLGLSILSAGGRYGPLVNREALVAQRAALAGGWMTLGEWLSTHPPLARRMAALEPALGAARPAGSGAGRAIGILLLIVGAIAAAGFAGASAFAALSERVVSTTTTQQFGAADLTVLEQQVNSDLTRIAAFLDAEIAAGRGLPTEDAELAARWESRTGDTLPSDPFDGFDYGYFAEGTTYLLWSSGPDGETGTTDDIGVTNQ